MPCDAAGTKPKRGWQRLLAVDRGLVEERVVDGAVVVLGDQGEQWLEAVADAERVHEVSLVRPAENVLVHGADRTLLAGSLGTDSHGASIRASSRRTWVSAFPSRWRFVVSLSQPLAPEGWGSGITTAPSST